MFSRSFFTSATLALLASSVLAEPLRQPYKANAMRMSVRSPAYIFGLGRRTAADGYMPTDQSCGAGDTCSEACGASYETCASKDGQTHCFDPSTKQTCCPNGTGDACDAGFFCSADAKGATWCCPDSMTLEQCAQAYGLPAGGALVSDSPSSTIPATASPSTIGTAPAGGNSSPSAPTSTAATDMAPASSQPPVNTPTSPSVGSGAGSAPSPSPSGSQIFVETSTSIGGAHPTSCTALTSEIIQPTVTPDVTAPLLTAGPQPPFSGTSTILIPVPTVRPLSSTVSVPRPSSTVPVAAGHRVAGSGTGFVAGVVAALAIVGLW